MLQCSQNTPASPCSLPSNTTQMFFYKHCHLCSLLEPLLNVFCFCLLSINPAFSFSVNLSPLTSMVTGKGNTQFNHLSYVVYFCISDNALKNLLMVFFFYAVMIIMFTSPPFSQRWVVLYFYYFTWYLLYNPAIIPDCTLGIVRNRTIIIIFIGIIVNIWCS